MISSHQPTIVLGMATLAVFLMSGNAPSVTQDLWLQQQLAEASERGISYRFVDSETIEFKETWSGKTWTRSLQEPGEATIRVWANARGIPILEIDPSQVDTNLYTGWYVYFTQVPSSNDVFGPLVVGDVDRNDKAEIYGIFKEFTTDYMSRIYQVDSTGLVTLLYTYTPLRGGARQLIDADNDSLKEVAFTLRDSLFDLEQARSGLLPTNLNFYHHIWQGNVDPGFTGVYFGSLDGDSLTDFLYKGSEPSSVDETMDLSKVYVAEFNPDSNNFVRVWSGEFVPGPQSGIGGFAVDDLDQDGRMEFAVVDLFSGEVFIVENTGQNSYQLTWQDSTPFVNLYYETSGDVDSDGKPELFVGATMSNGNWTTMFESDSNDHYSPKFLFHLLSAGTFDEPTYLTNDVDNDGRVELIIFSGSDMYIFKSREDNAYYLWYLKREGRIGAVQFYDFNKDGRKDFIISKTTSRFYADIYRATELTSVTETSHQEVEFMLLTNYPNPFNPTTTIEYTLPSRQAVRLSVYNALGQLVATLVNGQENPGRHAVTWNAEGFASGVYFCRLETVSGYITKKLLLIR